jgi:Aerotolerance regulator N-terminal
MIEFAHSLWLLGLAALAVPLLLHLFSRKVAPPKDFPPAVLLAKGGAKRISARHIKEFLLLAARLALLGLLVLAFARARLPEGGGGVRSETAPTALVLVIDDSVSMSRQSVPGEARGSGASTRLERALLEARDALSRLGPGSEAAAIFASGGSIGPTEPWKLADKLKALSGGKQRKTSARADLARGLDAAPRFLEAMKPLAAAVLVLSDCEAGAVGEQQIEQLEKVARVAVVDLGSAGCGDDWGLPGARLDRERLVAGEEAELLVRVMRSPGDGAAATRRLELVLGDVAVAWRTVSLSPGTEAEVPLRFSLKAGTHLGELRLVGGDAWKTNDRLPVALVAGKAVRVAVICAQERLRSVGRAVRLALSAGPGEERKAFLAETLAPGSAKLSSLAGFRAFVLVGPPKLEAEVSARLARRVADGAGMVVFAEDPAELGRLAVPLGLPVPPADATVVRFRDAARLVPERAGAGLFSSLRPALAAGVFSRALKLDVGQGTVLARLKSRSQELPGLVESRLGRGLLLVVASSPSARFSGLRLREHAALFVPFMHELTARAAGLTPAESMTVPDEAVELAATSRERSARFWLYGPDGLRSPLGSPGNGLRLHLAAPAAPGAYRVISEADGQQLAVRPLTVRYRGSEVCGKRRTGRKPGVERSALSALSTVTRPAAKGTELTFWLAIAGLVCLFLESLASFAARARPPRNDDDLPARQKRGRAAA